MGDEAHWTFQAENRIEANALTLWRRPWNKAKFGVSPFHLASNPVVAWDRVVASTFSPGALRGVDARTGRLVWHHDLSYGVSEPLVAGDVVLALGSQDLVAIRIGDGAMVWSGSLHTRGEPSTSLTLAAGIVVFGDAEGYAHAHDVSTGLRLWSKRTSRARNRGVNGKPIALDGLVIVGNNAGWVYGLDAKSGATVWRKRIGEIVWASGFLHQGLALIQSTDRVYGLSPKDGSIESRWSVAGSEIHSLAASELTLFANLRSEFPLPILGGPEGMRYRPERSACIEGPIVAWENDGPPFAGTKLTWSPETGLLYEATQVGLGIIDPKTGIRRWSVTGFQHKGRWSGERIAIPSVTRERIYLLTSDGSLVCLRHP